MKKILLFLFLLFLTPLAVSAFQGKEEVPGREKGVLDTEVLEKFGVTLIDPPIEVPNITFYTMEGEAKSMTDYRGHTVFLNFWATWCPPCRAEMPAMGSLADQLKDSDFVMLPIDLEEPVDLINAFLEEYDIKFPVFRDPQGEAARTMGIENLPTSLLIDREGKVVAAVRGALEWDEEELVEALLAWSL